MQLADNCFIEIMGCQSSFSFSDEAVRSTMYGFIESVHATLFKLTEKIAAIESSPKDSRESMDQNTQTEEVRNLYEILTYSWIKGCLAE